ncbi:hypothetical protein [Salinibacterium sp. ZJ454]|uniref:hypothetical protein n=1 Tax=Salinibacterium sp. ZJ454 TaxID=2708339 RepID=UPI0014207565|nr:hypothetical protein [Salinibacterium sp. ZJ454]
MSDTDKDQPDGVTDTGPTAPEEPQRPAPEEPQPLAPNEPQPLTPDEPQPIAPDEPTVPLDDDHSAGRELTEDEKDRRDRHN